MPEPTASVPRPLESVTRRRPTVDGVRRVRPAVAAATAPAMQVGRNLTPRGSAAAAKARATPARPATPKSSPERMPAKFPDFPRVAIVHDWLVGGGAELVVEQLHLMFPEAPIYTSYCTKEWRKRLDGTIRTGVLQYWPLSRLRKFIPPLRIWWFTHLDLRGYDLVISSSGAEAKGIRVPSSTIHINYCHAPTHYYWSRYDEYLAHPGFGMLDWLARWGLRTLVEPLRKWDYKAAQRPDYMIANSSHTKAEIEKYYDRSAAVIHPPVSTNRFAAQVNKAKRRGFVVAGRQTPYKRFDLAVAACTKLNLPLTVIGNGPDHRRLKKLAGKTITFLGKVSDEAVAEEFGRAQALIFPGVDDFGITAVEALAAGTPVIAYDDGGAHDYVTPGTTGAFFDDQTVESLARAIRTFSSQQFDRMTVARSAERFSPQEFQRKLRLFITKVLASAQR